MYKHKRTLKYESREDCRKTVGFHPHGMAARGGGSGTGFASTVSSKRNGKYYRWVKILFVILTKALQLWVCMWILIVAAVLADDMTLRENVSGDFWAKFPWVSKGLVTNNFVGLASL